MSDPYDLFYAYRNALIEAMAYDETGSEEEVRNRLWRYEKRLHSLVLQSIELYVENKENNNA